MESIHYLVDLFYLAIIVTQLQNIPVEMGSSICLASVCDPYLLVVSEQGAVMLLQLKIEEETRLTVLKHHTDLVCVLRAYRKLLLCQWCIMLLALIMKQVIIQICRRCKPK